ncbi:MAG TPA: MFS transporter [Candidatus Binatia bacterium]|nr:MFS transporter [Candidatus Binatia bacterium]
MSRQQRLVLIICILGSGVAFLDSSVVNVALPAIARNLGGGLRVQQWVVDAYLLSLGSLILLAGSLSDLVGRKRIMVIGLLGFGVASILCAIAPTNTFLIIARGIQGTTGALLIPSSLALIITTFSGKAQSKAIGVWTAWTGISFVIGPLLGGYLVDAFSWRLIFVINVVPIVICLWLLSLFKIKNEHSSTKLDYRGAILCSLGLLGTVFALIEQPNYGWGDFLILGPFIVGLILLVSFVLYERRIANPMLPLSLFKIRNFSAGNLSTVLVYGALSIATFLIVIFLQQVSGYSAFHAGLALLPVTIIMFFLSPQFGKLSGKYGPRLFMTFGPIVSGAGFLLMEMVKTHVDYPSQLLPGVLLFSLGLSMTVAPLTSAVLGDIEKKHSGIASAINNAIARIAGLIATALVGVIVGQKLNVMGFHRALGVTAGLLVVAGLISLIGIRNHTRLREEASDSVSN